MRRLRLSVPATLGISGGILVAAATANTNNNHKHYVPFQKGFKLGYLYEKYGSGFRQFLDAEQGHLAAIKVLSQNFFTRNVLGLVDDSVDPANLSVKVWDFVYSNPIGIAAGFDKHAEALNGLFDLGFGFVEIGSVTPLPQDGNPKPRVFRLDQDKAIINRYGFNSHGIDVVAERLKKFKLSRPFPWTVKSAEGEGAGEAKVAKVADYVSKENSFFSPFSQPNFLRHGPIGLNLGKNKLTSEENAVNDYVRGVETAGPYCDYIVINVSSPNTPGLRALQGKTNLTNILSKVKQSRDQINQTKSAVNNTKNLHRATSIPLLVKVAPDLNDEDIQDISDVCLEVGIDGIIVSNTTIKRYSTLLDSNKTETGGLSGAPLFNDSTRILAKFYQKTKGSIPLIGVGGINSGDDAYQKIRAGASLVQVYSTFAYDGPMLIFKMKKQLSKRLEEDKISLAEAVGKDASKY